jgi:hypothetical protein
MPATTTLPLDYALVVYSGTNFRREFRWLPDGVTGMDFTGWSATMPIGFPGAIGALILTDTNGGIILSSTGQIIINLQPVDTILLKPGVVNYNLDLTDPDGYVRRFLRGRISVVQDVKVS